MEANIITKVSGNTYLVRDGMQMWLAEKKTSKGKEYMRRISGYYTTFRTLLIGYAREQGLKTGGDDVKSALEQFAAIEQNLRELAEALGKELHENQQVD